MQTQQVLGKCWSTLQSVADQAEPYTGHSFKYVPGFAAIFAVIYLSGFAVMGNLGLTGKKRGTLASCCISILHGLLTTNLSGWQLYVSAPFRMDDINTEVQNIILELCLAYMLVDEFLFLIPITPDDWLFIGHHAMVIIYTIGSLLIGRGAVSCLILMCIGEITSPMQNSWYLAKDLRGYVKGAETAYKWISTPYTLWFILVRTCVGLPLISWFAWTITTLHPSAVPAHFRWTWASFAVLGVSGSQLWSRNLWKGYRAGNLDGEHPIDAKMKAFEPKSKTK